MDITINVDDYLSKSDIQKIVEDELRYSIRKQIRNESDIERVISNISFEFLFTMLSEEFKLNRDEFDKLIRDKIKEKICSDSIGYLIFRRKDAWDRSESPAVKILDEECANSRPLIKAAVEKHIAEYPFHELDRGEIGETIYQVIMEKILNVKKDD